MTASQGFCCSQLNHTRNGAKLRSIKSLVIAPQLKSVSDGSLVARVTRDLRVNEEDKKVKVRPIFFSAERVFFCLCNSFFG